MNEKLKDRIERECSAIDTDKRYREFLNECYNEQLQALGGPFQCMEAAPLIEEHSPTDYRCGYADWSDSESREGGWVTLDNGSSYFEREDCERERDELADEIAAEIVDLKVEREEIENMDGTPHHVADSDEAHEWGRLSQKIDDMEAEETAIRDESF